jgi:hypothetical protein
MSRFVHVAALPGTAEVLMKACRKVHRGKGLSLDKIHFVTATMHISLSKSGSEKKKAGK